MSLPTIENTTITEGRYNGVLMVYYVAPNEGYVLHDKRNDWLDLNPDTGEETLILGYSRGRVSVSANYDFEANPFELYAVPEDSVPGDQIFGGGGTPEVTE